MIPFEELINRGHIATALLVIAATFAYYVLVIKDRERMERNKRK